MSHRSASCSTHRTDTIYAPLDDLRVRKEIKIRPGFTPQEDVSRFRGTKQQQFERTQLPKGHILGWVPPSSEGAGAKKSASLTGPSGQPLSKSAKKREKAKEKKKEEKERAIKDSWEDDDDDVKVWPTPDASTKEKDKEEVSKSGGEADALADKLESTTI